MSFYIEEERPSRYVLTYHETDICELYKHFVSVWGMPTVNGLTLIGFDLLNDYDCFQVGGITFRFRILNPIRTIYDSFEVSCQTRI